jgi:uridine phosphorylase
MTTRVKDPESIEPYGFDWTQWLAEFEGSELIVASTWEIAGPDTMLVIDDSSIVTGSLKTQVICRAGTLGANYTVTNHVTTTSGYRDDRSFLLAIRQR